jgi:hypothetical protein
VTSLPLFFFNYACESSLVKVASSTSFTKEGKNTQTPSLQIFNVTFHFSILLYSFCAVERAHGVFPQLLLGPLAALEKQANLFVALFRAPQAPFQQGKATRKRP